jgi:hypothetical protein
MNPRRFTFQIFIFGMATGFILAAVITGFVR